MGIPIFLVALDIVSMIAAIGLAYYGARLFFHMRWGKLERSWKLMTEGAVIFSLGFLSLAIQDLSPVLGTVYIVSDYFGGVLSTVGIVLLFFGIRSHYSVWSLKNLQHQQERIGFPLRMDDDKKRESGISP